MTTVAAIAAAAFDAVAAEVTDAIQSATLTRTTKGAYSTTTATYAETTSNQTGRAVIDTVKPIADVFPDYVAGPGEELILLEGFTSCREGDTLTFGGRARSVMMVQDILGAGTLFYAVAR
ncbi:hypothetical protein [Actibacterium sp. MT2.3-13A]|uniref:hypothetical protein n=1 Tax=Actibacterium sp. MT2.3-13A TaxID=2828332 RepID=UPI001BAC2F77|nr:hypothetical protein [Actibacterium sp. MT2.3-13A]